MCQKAFALERRHFVAHCRRRNSQITIVSDVRRTHRLRGGDVFLYDGSEDCGLTIVKHLLLNRLPSVRLPSD